MQRECFFSKGQMGTRRGAHIKQLCTNKHNEFHVPFSWFFCMCEFFFLRVNSDIPSFLCHSSGGSLLWPTYPPEKLNSTERNAYQSKMNLIKSVCVCVCLLDALCVWAFMAKCLEVGVYLSLFVTLLLICMCICICVLWPKWS